MSLFVAALRRLTLHCEFGAHLDKVLRNCLVCGLSSEATQKRLLTESDLTFAKAAEGAKCMEMAVKNACTLQGSTPRDVNKRLARDLGKAQTGAITAVSQDIGIPTAS